MPKAPCITAAEAERLLIDAGFAWIRSNGSHRIYKKKERRVVIPFHAGTTLHPKIVREVLEAIDGR